MSRATLLYDEDCGFCRWALDKILQRDRRGSLRAVSIQSAEGAQLLGDLSVEQRMRSWHLIDERGRRFSAGDAVAPLARLLPYGAPVALLARRMPALTNRAYLWIASNRDRLGKRLGTQACSVDPRARRP